jgi:hypothetical protein
MSVRDETISAGRLEPLRGADAVDQFAVLLRCFFGGFLAWGSLAR